MGSLRRLAAWLAPLGQPWALAVFALALAARLVFLFLVDQPLLYTHQYHYFTNALRIAEHPDPVAYVLGSEEWRLWDGHWVIAPLYHIFAGTVFRLLGPHLATLQLFQCVLDSLTAVAVGALGRAVAGRHGPWAGAVYALYLPALEMPSWTMTETLHTALLVVALTVLVREAVAPERVALVGGGFLLGLSALARSVSSAFLALAALWRAWPSGLRNGWAAGALLCAGGAVAILPWTARNAFIVGDPILIESTAFENIWWANHLEDRASYLRQEKVVFEQPTPAAQRAVALHFALRGIRRHPDRFLGKIRKNFWHFLQLEGLHNLLIRERAFEPWRHAATLLLDDFVLLPTIPLFLVFLVAGRASPARGLILLWTAYYLFMVVVVFHNEIRYRSAFVPFAFAGAAGGWRVLAEAASRRRLVAWAALAVGLGLAAGMVAPYAAPAWRAVVALRRLRPATAALERGDLAAAERLATIAAHADPPSPRPWLEYGRRLVLAGHPAEAREAYHAGMKRADARKLTPTHPMLVLPRLLAESGEPEASARALARADRLSWDSDPWLLLEAAWRELPPPRTDEIVLAHGDYGAVRGFLHPRGGDPRLSAHRLEWNKYDSLGGPKPPPGTHRWSRHRAWLRLLPTRPAPAYLVTLHMGSPFPSTEPAPVVTVRVNGGPASRFTLDPEIRPYTQRANAVPGEPLVVQLDAPTWNRAGEPAEQGVRVDRMTVSAVGQDGAR